MQSGKTPPSFPPTSGSSSGQAAATASSAARGPRVTVTQAAGATTDPAQSCGSPLNAKDAVALAALLGASNPEAMQKLLGDAEGGELQELEATLTKVGDELRATWASDVVPLCELPSVVRATELIGKDAVEVFLANPVGAEALRSLVAESTLANSPKAEILGKLDRLALPQPYRRELEHLANGLALTERIQPTPDVLRKIAQEDGTIAVPLSKDAVLSADQKAALAGVQRWLRSGRVLAEDTRIGALDAGTLRQLQEINPAGAEAKEFAIDRRTVDTLYATAATLANYRETTVGELVFNHPAYVALRRSGANVDPIHFACAYLRALGYDFSPTSPVFDERFLRALHYSAERPVDRARVADAVASASRATPHTEGELREIASARIYASEKPLAFLASGPEKDPTAQRRALARLLPLMMPCAEIDLERKLNPTARALSDLPLYHPTIALKLLLCRIKDAPPPFLPDGRIDRALSAQDLCDLRDFRYGRRDGGPSTRDAAYERFTRVAEAIADGKLVLADLANDIAGDAPLVRDINWVLGELRNTVAAVRMNALPFDRPESAVRATLRQTEPLANRLHPFDDATVALAQHFGDPAFREDKPRALDAADFARLARLRQSIDSIAPKTARDDARPNAIRYAAEKFASDYDASGKALDDVANAIRAGTLIVRDREITTTPRNLDLENAAESVRGLLIAGADVLVARARAANNGILGRLHRVGISAANHLFVLPNFGDATALMSMVEDWTVIALRAEMRAAGKKTPEAKDEKAACEGACSETRELSKIDADVLDWITSHHANLLGPSAVEVLSSGTPSSLPNAAESKRLLARVAKLMRAGLISSWDSAHVSARAPEFAQGASAAIDETSLNHAKVIVQTALRRMHGREKLFGKLIPGKEGVAAKDFVERLLSLDGPSLAPLIKGFAVQQGAADLTNVGDIRDATVPQSVLSAVIAASEKAIATLAESAPDIAFDLRQSLGVLEKVVAEGRSITLERGVAKNAEDRALRSVVMNIVASLAQSGEMQMFDYDEMLARAPGKPRVSGPMQNYFSEAGEVREFGDVLAQMGQTTRWKDTGWTKRAAAFDVDRAWQGTIANYVLFRKLMSTLISYDMWIAPFVKSGRALREWHHADTQLQREDAVENFQTAWREWLDLLAMFTAFKTPTGFGLDLFYELQRANLDVALGKGIVFAPFMWHGAKAMPWMIRGMRQTVGDLAARNRPLAIWEIGRNTAVPTRAIAGTATSATRKAAAGIWSGAGHVPDTLLHPGETISEGLGAARTAAGKLAPTRFLRFGESKTIALAADDLAFIAKHADPKLCATLDLALFDGKAARPTRVAVADLLEFARHPDGKIPKDLAKRLGLVGPRKKELARAFGSLRGELKPLANALRKHAASEAKAGRSLVSAIDATIEALAKNPKGRTTWKVPVPKWNEITRTFEHVTKPVTMRNSLFVKLVRHGRFADDKHLLAMLPNRLHDRLPAIRTILANYADVSAAKARSLDRAASVMDAAYRWRLMKTTTGWPWLRFALVTGAIAIPAVVGGKLVLEHKRRVAKPRTT